MDCTLFAESVGRMKESLLWAAAKGGHVEDCLSLIEYGADLNWVNVDGETALLAACKSGHSPITELLITHGADVNKASRNGSTPLHVCAQRGDQTTIKLLIAANCLSDATNSQGLTARTIAIDKGFHDIAVLLENAPTASHNHNDSPITRNRAPATNLRRGRLPSIPSSRTDPDGPIAALEEFTRLINNMQATPRSDVSSHQSTQQTLNISHTPANDDLSKQLSTEVERLQEQSQTLEQKINELQIKINHYQGKDIDVLTLTEIEQLEQELRTALDTVVRRKDNLMQEEIVQQREQRLCVVCQEKEKSVVFLPCRHMCVCASCACHDRVNTCPLCRRPIETRFSVYA